MKIPLVDLSREHKPLAAEMKEAFARVLESGRFVLGPEVTSLEKEVAEFTGADFAIGLSSGTDALLAALMAHGVGPGDEVVTTPMSFFATAGCVVRLGAKPVFVDIDPDTFNMNPEAAKAAITSKTKALLPVNLFGRPADLPETDCPVIEDAAQSIGSVGPRGLAACLSFFPTKNLGALGDGGAVLTNDEAFADKIRLLRTQGSRPKYHHPVIGGNFRIDALQASLLRVKLPKLAAWTEARRQNADKYRERFRNSRAASMLRLPSDAPNHVYNQFVIRVPRRDDLRKFLSEKGISTEIYYPLPLHLQPCLEYLGYKEGQMPNSETVARDSVALPVFPSLSDAEQDYIVETIEEFLVK